MLPATREGMDDMSSGPLNIETTSDIELITDNPLTNNSAPASELSQEHEKPEPLNKTYWLINRNFTFLATGQAISSIGDFVYSTTVLIWVLSMGGTAAAVSGVWIAQYLPVFLLGPLAGVLVDRWHRLRTMIFSDIARAIIALLPLFAPATVRLPAIYLSVCLISALGQLFRPAQSGVTKVIVDEKQQPQAASINQVMLAISFIAGPALAAPLYIFVGPVVAILINAASYVVSVLSLFCMRIARADLDPTAMKLAAGEAKQASTNSLSSIFIEMREGWSFILKTRVLFILILLGIIAMLGAGLVNTLEILYVKQRLHADITFYGYLGSISGLGMLIGAVLAGLLAQKVSSERMLSGSFIWLGVFLSVYALQTSFAGAAVAIFVAMIMQAGLNVGIGPILMKATPDHYMGRVNSSLNVAMYGSSLLTAILAGWSGQFFSAYLVFLAGSIIIAISGLGSWFALPEPPKVETSQIER